MVTDQQRTVEALRIAIQMEIDGREYYLKISRNSGNEPGRKLLQALADAEDIHRQTFESIYEAIRVNRSWPVMNYHQASGRKLRTLFAEALKKARPGKKAPATEIDAVQTAIGMEVKTYDYYKDQSKKAGHGVERDFYEALAAEEQAHHLALLDYHEYLSDPAAWFVKKEHPSLDGA